MNSGTNGPFCTDLFTVQRKEPLRGRNLCKCRAISTSGIVRRLVEIEITRRRKYSSVCFCTRFNTRDSIVQETTLFIPDFRSASYRFSCVARARSRTKRMIKQRVWIQ